MGQPKHEGKRAVARAKRRQKHDLLKAGIKAKIDTVLMACGSAEFQRRFSEAAEREGDTAGRMTDVERMARAVLDDMGVAHADVRLTFSWDPNKRQLTVYFRPNNPIAQAARAALASVPAPTTT